MVDGRKEKKKYGCEFCRPCGTCELITKKFVCPLQEGGVSGFLHSFIAEVFAMVRAHVAALGGNAVVSYSMKDCVLMENPNKNQVPTQTSVLYLIAS